VQHEPNSRAQRDIWAWGRALLPLLLAVLAGTGCAYQWSTERYSSPRAPGAQLLPYAGLPYTAAARLSAGEGAPAAALVPIGRSAILVVPCNLTEHRTTLLLLPPIPFPFSQTVSVPDRFVVGMGLDTQAGRWRIDASRVWLERRGERVPLERWGNELKSPVDRIGGATRDFEPCRRTDPPPRRALDSPIEFPAAVDDYRHTQVPPGILKPISPDLAAMIHDAAARAAARFAPHRFDATLWLQFATDADPTVPATLYLGGISQDHSAVDVPPVELHPGLRAFTYLLAP
jgi:hypothetical protein